MLSAFLFFRGSMIKAFLLTWGLSPRVPRALPRKHNWSLKAGGKQVLPSDNFIQLWEVTGMPPIMDIMDARGSHGMLANDSRGWSHAFTPQRSSEPQDNDVQNVQKTQWAAEWARLNSQFQASHRDYMIAANEPCSDRFFKAALHFWKWAKEKRFEV